MIQYIGAGLLIGISIYAFLFKRNLIKLVIGLNILQSSANFLLISLGYKYGPDKSTPTAPIWVGYTGGEMVGPLPQALVLTSIVIGVCVTALALAICLEIYSKRRTLNINKLEETGQYD